jgi:hypothetical protein
MLACDNRSIDCLVTYTLFNNVVVVVVIDA